MKDNALPEGFSIDPVTSSDLPEGFKLDGEDSDQAEVDKYLRLQESHGGLGQQAKTLLEGAASGASFGLSTGLERSLGVDPEDIRARREANPITHMVGQVGGSLLGLGKLKAITAMTGAGSAASKLLIPAVMEGTTVGRLGGAAVKGAVENAMFQAGDEVSKMLSLDPHQSVETAVTNVGLASLFGGGVNVGLSAVSPLWNATLGKELGSLIDNFKGDVTEGTLGSESVIGGLKKMKKNAAEIKSAANEIGAPVLESQISASKHIQDIDSMLMQSPTPVGVARQQTLQQGLDAAESAVARSLEGGSNLTAVEVGNKLKEGLKTKLEAEYQPIAEMYDLVKASTDHIPVSPHAKRVIAANIKKLEGYKFKGSNMRQVGDSLLENLEHINTVDDIKRFSTDLNNRFRINAGFEVGEVVGKLRNLEENSILRAAENLAKESKVPGMKDQVAKLIDERKMANEAYKGLKEKMADLGAVLGKKRPRGTSDFLDFIDNLTPEAVTKKLFAKGNSEFLESFAKNFPEEFQTIVGHEKGKLLFDNTIDGVLNSRKVLDKIDNLSPEVQRLMFTPSELKQLNAARTYLEAIPKNINPSGTSKAEAYRRFFTNPASSTLEAIRDTALGKMMKALVKPGEEALFAKSIFPAIGPEVINGQASPSALKAAVDYGMKVIRGEREIYKSARAVFTPGRSSLPESSTKVSESDRERLEKRVEDAKKNPEKLLNLGGETAHYMPNHTSALAETAGRVIQYLDAVKPKPMLGAPLDAVIEPSQMEKAQYARVLDIAEKPLSILGRVSDGTLLPSDIEAMNAMYPSLYQKISQALTNEMIEITSKGETIPYQRRQTLSLFLGQTLDSTLAPQNIMAAQNVFAEQKAMKAAAAEMAPPKTNTSKLADSSKAYQTSSQASASRQQA